ncbi:PAS domain S-box [Cylindrospermum stagnale PCC 7417]|uniref:histidine kinase n=1 Tax=Cylindrospermum stagnale PCC 7417 TaxID=56107 RepID=K9X0B3_9NOST|nr:PAS domain S-box protein [Cylindrospermum stagnale]AFZ25509.1 PAS domain S-box [Cylindrospermum stagnale PCC 7417]
MNLPKLRLLKIEQQAALRQSKTADKLELIPSRDLQQAIFNQSADAIFLVDRETLLTTDCNHRAVELFAASSKAELINIEGQSLQKQPFTPDELATIVEAINRQGFWSREIEYITKQGNCFWGNLAIKQIQVAGQVMNLVRVTDISERKRAELALQEREAMLRVIGDNLPNGAVYQVIRELDGCDSFTYLSAGIERLMEVSAQEALRDSTLLYRQFIPEDSLRLQAAVDQSHRHLSVFDIQLRIRTPSGQLKWFHFRSTPQKLHDGRVAWNGLVVDVTDLKRTEETLRKSEALLEESQRVARLGNWEFDLTTGKISWSKKLFDLFNRDLALGEPNYEENLGLYHPEDRQKLAQAVEIAIATGESYKQVLRVPQPDASDRYFEGIGYAEFNAEGKVIRLYGTAQDITERQTALRERQKAEEKLRQREAQLASAQQIAHIGSWEWNLETQQRTWSTETFRIFGLNPTQPEPTQAEFLQMVHPDDRSPLQTYLELAIADGTPYNIEYRVVRPDGSVRYIESKAEIAKDAQGQAVKLLGAILDITERKQTELEIIHSRDLLEAVYNESADALFLADTKTLVTTDCNDRAVELFEAASKAELINIVGSTLHKLPFTPDELATIIEATQQQRLWSREIEYLTKQGNSFWGSIAIKQIKVAGQAMNLLRVKDITARKRVEEEHQQAEAALARSEEQLRLTLEFTHIGIWDWNVQTGEVIWNDNHYRLLGLVPETSTDMYQLWLNSIHPEDVDRVEQALLNALAQHTNYEAEYRVIHPNGKIHWLIGKGQGIYNEVNDPVRMLGVIIDVSERKLTEASLRRYERIVSTTMDGMALVNRNYIYQVVNQAYQTWRHKSRDEIVGYSMSDILGQEVFEQVIKPRFDQCLAGQKIQYEMWFDNPDKEAKFLSVTYAPYLEVDQTISGVVLSIRDITDRNRAEQMLDLQAVITRNMAEGICLVRRADGMIVYTNPKFEQMFGYDSHELVGQHISIVNYTNENINPEAVHQAIASAVTQKGEATYEIHNIKKDGTPFWCSATTSVFEHTEYGTVLVAVQQDITEHKQAEEKIKASLKEKEVLLKEIHHRVKNNLGIVSSLLQMQYRRTQDPQANAILRDSQNRISSIALVHEKLYRSDELSDIDFAQYIPDLTTHLFDSYNVSNSLIQLNIQVDHASLDIETAIPCGLIINELVSNALKYAFPSNCEGKIQVRFYQECDRTLKLIIRDNGVGLPEDFDSKKAKTLGITLVQGLVKQLRGIIEINRQEGTEFKITFTKNRV